jgi:hypothetical protein
MYYAMYNVNYNWKLVLRNDRHKRDACASGGSSIDESLVDGASEPKNYTFFGNIENYTNLRQTDFGSLKSAPYNTPQFKEV